MHRIDHSTAVAVKPAITEAGAPGYFTGGDALKGQDATWMTYDFANDVQENICEAIEGAGIELLKGDGAQLLKAIVALARSNGIPFGVPLPFAGIQSAIPAGFVPVMGQIVARSAYPGLTAFVLSSGLAVDDGTWLGQAVHQTKFSLGDGATTIRLPDLRGESIYGSDLGRGVRSGAIGDWLTGDMQPHVHGASSDSQGSHAHAGTTDAGGTHAHNGATGAAGAHNHTHDGFSRILKPPYVGSYTGDANSSGSGAEQAIGPGDSGDLADVPDHSHTIPADGLHAHNFTTLPAGSHNHNITVASAGGSETRQRGTNYPFIMRIL